MKLEGANLGPCIVGFCGNSHAVNGTEHYWVPQASPQGRLGGLDLTTGIGHGTVGRDVPAPWQTVLIMSPCRCFAGHRSCGLALAAQAAQEQRYYLVTCLVTL